jgi:hypothetical protein
MKPVGSLPCSQCPISGPCPKPDKSSPQLSTLFPKIHSYSVLSSMPWSSKWSLPFKFSNQNFLWISYFSHACHMPYPTHPSWYDYLNIFGVAYKLQAPRYVVFPSLLPYSPSLVQIFSSALCSQMPSIYDLLLVWETKIHRIMGKIIALYILIFKFSERRCEDKRFWTKW